MTNKLSSLLVLISLTTFLACKDEVDPPSSDGPTPYPLNIPSSLPSMPIPPDNPLTVEGVALGKKLFYDPV
ncbi:MAG: cytochrome C peroxidase, partial [Bacteroidota bacterium]